MSNAVVRDFPPETIQPGDVFLRNDPYLCGGSSATSPISAPPCRSSIAARWSPTARPSATTTMSAGGCRVRCRARPRPCWMEGVPVPPIKLYTAGKLNEAAFRIITRNSRLSEHPRRRPGRRDAAGRSAAGESLRWPSATGRDARSRFEQILEKHRRDLPARNPAQDQGRRLSLRGLCRARRRRRPRAARAPR